MSPDKGIIYYLSLTRLGQRMVIGRVYVSEARRGSATSARYFKLLSFVRKAVTQPKYITVINSTLCPQYAFK